MDYIICYMGTIFNLNQIFFNLCNFKILINVSQPMLIFVVIVTIQDRGLISFPLVHLCLKYRSGLDQSPASPLLPANNKNTVRQIAADSGNIALAADPPSRAIHNKFGSQRGAWTCDLQQYYCM